MIPRSWRGDRSRWIWFTWAGFGENDRNYNNVVNLFQLSLSFPKCSLSPPRPCVSVQIHTVQHTDTMLYSAHSITHLSALQSGLISPCYFRFVRTQYASFSANILLKWNTCLFVRNSVLDWSPHMWKTVNIDGKKKWFSKTYLSLLRCLVGIKLRLFSIPSHIQQLSFT